MLNAIQEGKRCNRLVIIPRRNTTPFQELIGNHFGYAMKRGLGMYSPRNDPQPRSPIRGPRSDPQLILGMEWYSVTELLHVCCSICVLESHLTFDCS